MAQPALQYVSPLSRRNREIVVAFLQDRGQADAFMHSSGSPSCPTGSSQRENPSPSTPSYTPDRLEALRVARPEAVDLLLINMVSIFRVRVWTVLLLTPLGATIGLSVARGDILVLGVLLGAAFFALLVQKPELSLAVQFNGTLLYFYLLSTLGLETSRSSTGGFFLFLVGSTFLGGLALAANQPRKVKLGSIDVLFLCFFCLVFLSYLVSSRGTESAYKKITYAPLLVIGPYVCVQLLLSPRRIRKYLEYCVILPALVIIPSFYELSFTSGGRFSLYGFRDDARMANVILFGVTFANVLIIVSVWILESKGLRVRYILLAIPSAFLLLRAGSRGALVSCLITLAFYVIAWAKIRLRLKILTILTVVLLLIGCYQFVPKSTTDFYRTTLEYESLPEGSVAIRLAMWRQAFEDFKTSPMFGVGVGNSVRGIGFPHNILLEVSAELGVLGLALLLVMCVLTVREARAFIKACEDNQLVILMKISLLLFVSSLVEAMFSGYITNQTYLFMSIAFVSSISKMQTARDCHHVDATVSSRSRLLSSSPPVSVGLDLQPLA